ncbi:ORF6C domain protein [Desulfosporosinus acididurans]|uniref:ORF6C domain protein n=1 Tax=Desulfosporosinus acididurans TaxID=476652 RepID=A0A0J1FM76_9FIRM|nr:ORF6C domain-containing protein [Desulfosporosinus acididurans]KLU64053.1 ORF6C domain protein [Desulfosporosinus acididurans]
MNLITVSGVKGYIDENGTAWLSLEDVARGLGFTEKKLDGKEYVRWNRVGSYLSDYGFATSGEDGFIPENLFYLLAMKANNQIAVAFQMKVADEILPSIRKTGSYSVQLSPAEALLKSVELLAKQERELNTVKETQAKNQEVLVQHEFALTTLDQKVRDEITLTTREQAQIQGAVKARIRKLGDRSLFAKIYSALKRQFGVPSYRDLKRSDLSKAFRFIESWRPGNL